MTTILAAVSHTRRNPMQAMYYVPENLANSEAFRFRLSQSTQCRSIERPAIRDAETEATQENLKMKPITSSFRPNFRRRTLVLGITALSAGPVLSISPVLLLLGPTLLAGILGIIGIRMQVGQADRQHAEQMRLNNANLQLAQQQLVSQNRMAMRQERLAILTALIGRSETFAEQFLGNNMALAQNIAVEPDLEPANGVLSENADRAGTRLGLHRGRLAVERGGTGATVNNHNAMDLGYLSAYSEDTLPIPVSGIVRDINQRMAVRMKEQFASDNRIATVDDVEKEWSLAGLQQFSRATRPRGNPDIQAAAFIPRSGGRNAKFVYTNVQKA